MLAEARKLRLHLVLATQTLAQLSGRTSRRLVDVLLGNVANLITLRVGVRDAEILAPWFKLAFTIDDLVGLPDFQAVPSASSAQALRADTRLKPLPRVGEASLLASLLEASLAHCRRRD